jgi:tetratricopeptide (TPR) repeat protein
LQAGDLGNALIEAEGFLESISTIAEPNLYALAWEAKARVALAYKDRELAVESIEGALRVLDHLDLPVVAWRVYATAWDAYRFAGQNEQAEAHLERARQGIMRLADSFEPGEPLRESLLSAAMVRRCLGQAVSA